MPHHKLFDVPVDRSKAGLVRCLGPDAKEHTFLSPDRVKVRVCKRCRERQRDVSPGLRECTTAKWE